jgi:hypothetical protein
MRGYANSAIEQRILADSALFQVREIAYDPRNATPPHLQDEGAAMSSSARASARWRRRPASWRS